MLIAQQLIEHVQFVELNPHASRHMTQHCTTAGYVTVAGLYCKAQLYTIFFVAYQMGNHSTQP